MLNQWFTTNKTGFDYSAFCSVLHWAENDGRAWIGTYYCYSPESPQLAANLVLPKTLTGQIVFAADGSVKYTPVPDLRWC